MVFESTFIAKWARTFRALADPVRMGCLLLLHQAPSSVSDMVKALQVDQPRISHHLAVLKRSGVVADRREGRRIIYYLVPAICKRHDGAFVLDVGTFRLRIAGHLGGSGDAPPGGTGELAKKCAGILGAFARPKRLAIALMLFDGPRGSQEIASALGMTRQAANKQLSFLKTTGVFIEQRHGDEVVYRPHPVLWTRSGLDDVVDCGFLRIEFRQRRQTLCSAAETCYAVVEISLPRAGFSDREMRSILDMAVDFMTACQFQLRKERESLIEAYFQRLTFETAQPVTQRGLYKIYERGRDALWLSHLKISPEGLEGPEPKLMDAARNMMRVLESCAEGVLRFGRILAAKVTRLDDPAVLVGIVSAGMQHELESIPGFLQTPGFVFDYLAEQD